MTVRHDGHRITWLGYATTRIETPDGRILYLDPGRYGVLDDYDGGDADVVCVTHDHHYDDTGIHTVSTEDTTIVIYDNVDPARITRDVAPIDSLHGDVQHIAEHDSVTIDGFTIQSVPAYNHDDGPHVDDSGTPFHPEGFGVGYHIDTVDRTIFWPGDTDVLDHHTTIATSLLLPPIGGSFTMDRHDAAALAETIDPDLVLPIHYDTFDALETDAQAFAGDVADRNVPVVLETPAQ